MESAPTEQTDVLIVGGGPVGAFLAAMLLGRGIRTLVLESRIDPHTHSRAIGIHPPALDLLGRLGLADELVSRGAPIREGIVRMKGATLGGISFAPLGAKRGFILSVPQHVTQNLLDAAVVERAASFDRGAGLRRGCEVTRLTAHVGGIRVDAETSEGRQSFLARFVVGADGPRSTVRAAAGGRTRVRHYGDHYLMADVADSTGAPSTAILHFEREGLVESFPLPNGRRRWVVRTDEDARSLTIDALADIVNHRAGEVIDPSTASMLSAFVPRRRIATRFAGQRIALVGDAAHEISPIGGQGMNLGWMDAAMLADDLPDLLREKGGSVGLRDWERARIRSAVTAARRAEFNMSFGRPASPAAAAMRASVIRSLAHPPVDKILAKIFTMHGL